MDTIVNDISKQYGGPPIVFMRETKNAKKQEWLKHEELYEALADVIVCTHITGLQRVRGMWRIYVENIDDKVSLLTEGVTLRGKMIKLLNTNPNRLDGEQTVRIRVKDIPLSVDDSVILRSLVAENIDVITIIREKLRVKGKLTNCENGDRLCIVKSSSLSATLPKFMAFGHFTGRVFHPGQNSENKELKCRKCLETGHKMIDCENDWRCLDCHQIGHKKGECELESNPSSTPQPDIEVTQIQDSIQQAEHKEKAENAINGQKPIDAFVVIGADSQVTPNKGKKPIASERSPPTPAEVLNDESKKSRLKDCDTRL
ncbi:hypothetical protein MAR_036264 [Mya arenaria]|uniref:CCHC-type domain-containing protein n=1 Tax=Mya arenaria TaxID=6604 RepID=A0ABY7EMH3_MYAAR|nr:hypothetical protein MAR_036264 [Mya arenaria]